MRGPSPQPYLSAGDTPKEALSDGALLFHGAPAARLASCEPRRHDGQVTVAIPGLREIFIASFDGTPLCVQIVDDEPERERPGLLLVNGLGATVVTWRLAIERFRSLFRIVSFDTRGLHKSGRPLGGCAALDVDAHARDVVAVADAVAFDRFHALGWSMGVQVLIEAAPLLGDRLLTLGLHNGVAGYVFADLPGVGLAGSGGAAVVDAALAAMARSSGSVERLVSLVADEPALIRAFMALGFVHPDLDRETFGIVAAGFKKLDAEVFITILRHLGRHNAWNNLPGIAAPTLVIAGANDRMTRLTTMRRMVERLPRGELAVLADGTHYAALEQPRLFHDALNAFWQKHATPGVPF